MHSSHKSGRDLWTRALLQRQRVRLLLFMLLKCGHKTRVRVVFCLLSRGDREELGGPK